MKSIGSNFDDWMDKEGFGKKSSKKIGGWICHDCGMKYGKSRFEVSTWHNDVCDYCKESKAVTEARDYGYPQLPEVRK